VAEGLGEVTDPLTLPALTSQAKGRILQDALIREHAEAAFATHPEVDDITFEAVFPNGTISVTLNRKETWTPRRDFDGWREEVEKTWVT
jgi:hypothetical protein